MIFRKMAAAGWWGGEGGRPCLRYQQILMEYQDEQLQRHVQRFSGFTAQVIQHEVDHLEGIII